LLFGDKDVRGAEYFLQGHSGGSLFDKQLGGIVMLSKLGLQRHGFWKSWEKSTFPSQNIQPSLLRCLS